MSEIGKLIHTYIYFFSIRHSRRYRGSAAVLSFRMPNARSKPTALLRPSPPSPLAQGTRKGGGCRKGAADGCCTGWSKAGAAGTRARIALVNARPGDGCRARSVCVREIESNPRHSRVRFISGKPSPRIYYTCASIRISTGSFNFSGALGRDRSDASERA